MLNKEHKTSATRPLADSIAIRAAKVLLALLLAFSNAANASDTPNITEEEILLLQGLDKLLTDSDDLTISKARINKTLGSDMTKIYCQAHENTFLDFPHLVTCATDFITNTGLNRIHLNETFNFDTMRPMEWSITFTTAPNRCISEKTLRNMEIFKWLPNTPRECKIRKIHNPPPDPNCPSPGKTFNSIEDIDFSEKITITMRKECASIFTYEKRIKQY